MRALFPVTTTRPGLIVNSMDRQRSAASAAQGTANRLTLFQPRMEERGKPVPSATEARQATRGQGVRYVLAVSVALAVAAMVIAYFVA